MDEDSSSTIIYSKRSTMQLIFRITTLEILLEAIFIIIVWVIRFIFNLISISFDQFIFFVLVYLIIRIAQIMIIIYLAYDWSRYSFAVNRDEIIINKSINKSMYPLNNIENFRVHKTRLGRLFDYGDIYIKQYHVEKEISIDGIDKVEKFADAINSAMVKFEER